MSATTVTVPDAQRPVATETTIVLDRVSKSYDEKRVLTDLSFAVERGQIFGLIGPSGSGKTTAIRMITGVHAPDSGTVRVMGQEPRAFSGKTRERLGYMPQHFALYPELSVLENLDFVASCYGVPLRGRSKRLRRQLALVELLDALGTPAGSTSGGMQRRLELACTLIHEPEVIVVDEPTAGIDPVLRQKLWDHFRELRDAGRTLFVTTQYVTEAEYCDVVAALREGELLALGPPDDIRRAAMGGEIIELTAEGLSRDRLAAISRLDGVLAVQRVSPDKARITVEDAGRFTPALMSALQAENMVVGNVSPFRPNFDEVFVRLMEAKDNASGRREPVAVAVRR